jgi:hypothetical protein
MTYTWSTGAAAVLEHVEDDWAGVWSLLFAATKATFRLSLQLPPDVGAELAIAAMDTGEARDEVTWAHPEVPTTAVAVDLGPVGPALDVPATCSVIVGLLDGALRRLGPIAAADPSPGDRQLARRIGSKVRMARDVLMDARP